MEVPPRRENRSYWRVVDSLIRASGISVEFIFGHPDGSLIGVDLSSEDMQQLLSAEAVDEDNSPLRGLINAITRAVNENGGGDWSNVGLSGVREVVMAFVSKEGVYLQYVSDALKDDREVVLAACNRNGMALRYASVAVQNDREVVMVACNQFGWALENASDALKDDREVVMAACNQDGRALGYASAALKVDRDVVAAAINQVSVGRAEE